MGWYIVGEVEWKRVLLVEKWLKFSCGVYPDRGVEGAMAMFGVVVVVVLAALEGCSAGMSVGTGWGAIGVRGLSVGALGVRGLCGVAVAMSLSVFGTGVILI